MLHNLIWIKTYHFLNFLLQNLVLKFVPGGFYIFAGTLSNNVAQELAKEVSQKYELNIRASHFLKLISTSENSNAFSKYF